MDTTKNTDKINRESDLQSAIMELQRLTGLPLSIGLSEQDLDWTIRQVKAVSSAYRLANDKEFVLKRWISGAMDRDEFSRAANRLRLKKDGRRVVYLICLNKVLNPEISLVLKNMLPDSSTWMIPMDRDRVVIVYHFPKRGTADTKGTAYELLSALNTELMEQAFISYSDMVFDLMDLPEAYRQAVLAMDAGNTFSPDKMIFSYAELGVGRLILDVSPEVCRAYIMEELGEAFLSKDMAAFGADLLKTADCLIDNNLNIAETSRKLHIHRNTLLYRLEQIQNETGLDIRQFKDAMTYRMCSMVLLFLFR